MDRFEHAQGRLPPKERAAARHERRSLDGDFTEQLGGRPRDVRCVDGNAEAFEHERDLERIDHFTEESQSSGAMCAAENVDIENATQEGSPEVRFDGAVDKFVHAARNFASELEREKISGRTFENHSWKAKQKLCVGRRTYGYDNVEVKEGERRLRVEYRRNDEQANVIVEIFTRYSRGAGLRSIAKELNARAVAPPRAGKRGTGSWSPSGLHTMLRNEKYRGVIIWGRFEKSYRKGTKVRLKRPQSEWLRVEAEHLRIVSDDLWFAAQAQMRGRTVDPQKAGRKGGGRPARHMLSGIGRCAACGGPMTVVSVRNGTMPIKVYACAYHRTRGETVCGNKLRRPVDKANDVIARWLSTAVLREEVVLAALEEARRRLADRAKISTTDLEQLEKDCRRLRGEIANMVNALASARYSRSRLSVRLQNGTNSWRRSSLDCGWPRRRRKPSTGSSPRCRPRRRSESRICVAFSPGTPRKLAHC